MKAKKIKKFIKVLNKQNKEKLVTRATWLPVFPGFYNTFFDESEGLVESETDLSEDEYKDYYEELFNAGVTHEFFNENLWNYIDFSDCYGPAAESICYGLLDLNSAGIIKDIDFEKLVSPKYYNFSSDSINCEIQFNPKKLEKYLKNNLQAFTEYIKGKYTSRDGFSSWFSNNVENWLEVSEYGEHEVGSVLQFIIFNEYDDESEAIVELLYASNCSEAWWGYRKIDTESMIEDFKNKAA